MGIFIALALVSYNPRDPSINALSKAMDVKNYCGIFGSLLADLLYQVLGLSAWLLVLGNLSLAVNNFKNGPIKFDRLRGAWASLLLLTAASLVALYFPETKLFSGYVMAGGLVGTFTAQALIRGFNDIGVGIILWTAAIILTVFYTEKPIDEIFDFPKKVFKWLWLKAQWSKMGAKTLVLFREGLTKSAEFIRLRILKEPQLLTENHGIGTTHVGPRKIFPIGEDKIEDKVENLPTDLAISVSEPLVDTEQPEEIRRRPISLKKKVQRHIENWELPKLGLLQDPPYNRKRIDEREVRDKAQRLLNKLEHFGISGEVVGAKPGPCVTMFEYKPSADVKISRITDLADDLSLELSSESVRIIAPIPGRDVVGIETSNSLRETVYLKEILASDEFWDEKISLPLPLGCEANGSHKVVDLRKMPHLMVAGSTGSGKSVFVVSLLTGLLFRHSPKTLRLILVDPKQVDLAAFSKVPHLLMPAIREPKKAINALRWAIKEMDKRYRSMAKFGARDLESFNNQVTKLNAMEFQEHEQKNQEFEDNHQLQNSYYYTSQPYTVIVIEEFGDLMAVDKHNVEHSVVRLAQMARACGIHLILAMQSPRKDVVTGLIKTNIPGRVSFKVASKMDSRIILDESGAERLLTRGDMLFLAPGVSKPQRHHGPFVTDEEIQSVTNFWTQQAEPEFDTSALRALEGPASNEIDMEELNSDGSGNDFDERYDEILAYVATLKEVSASHIQTRFRLGYPRAARLMEVLEQQGVVGPASGSKKRQVLINELK